MNTNPVGLVKVAWLGGLLTHKVAPAKMRKAAMAALNAIDGDDARGLVAALREVAVTTTDAETRTLALDVAASVSKASGDVRAVSVMREHFRGVVWPRLPVDIAGGTVYRYAIVGVLVTDQAIEGLHPNETVLAGPLHGRNPAHRIERSRAMQAGGRESCTDLTRHGDRWRRARRVATIEHGMPRATTSVMNLIDTPRLDPNDARVIAAMALVGPELAAVGCKRDEYMERLIAMLIVRAGAGQRVAYTIASKCEVGPESQAEHNVDPTPLSVWIRQLISEQGSEYVEELVMRLSHNTQGMR